MATTKNMSEMKFPREDMFGLVKTSVTFPSSSACPGYTAAGVSHRQHHVLVKLLKVRGRQRWGFPLPPRTQVITVSRYQSLSSGVA